MKDRYPNMDMNTAHLDLEKGRAIILNMDGCNEKDDGFILDAPAFSDAGIGKRRHDVHFGASSAG